MKTLTTNQDGLPIDENGNVVNLQELAKTVQTDKKRKKPVEKQIQQVEHVEKKETIKAPERFTKYEVGENCTFTVKFAITSYENRILIVNDNGDLDLIGNVEKHWVKFKMWNYIQELEWKNESTEYDSAKRIHMLNADKLNEFKIRNLLVSWSFGELEDKLKLFHVNEFLVDESLKTFYSLQPNIVRHIIDEMNNVLEFNG